MLQIIISKVNTTSCQKSKHSFMHEPKAKKNKVNELGPVSIP
jgi:hypothetical protein